MNKSYQIWEQAKAAAVAHPGKPSLVICLDGTYTLTWTPKAELKGTDPASRPLPEAAKEPSPKPCGYCERGKQPFTAGGVPCHHDEWSRIVCCPSSPAVSPGKAERP